MKAKLLQMPDARPVEAFSRTVPTVESDVRLTIRDIADEDGTRRMCQIVLPHQEEARSKLCLALLEFEQVDELIGALTTWKALP